MIDQETESVNELKVVDNNELSIVAEKIVKANNIDEVKDLTSAFLLAHMKKDAMRSVKLSDLKDSLINQLEKRATTHPDEMSNKDLKDFIELVSNQETKSKDNIINPVQQPSVIINNTPINITNETTISRESRERVVDLIKSILSDNTSDEIIDADYTEKEEGDQ